MIFTRFAAAAATVLMLVAPASALSILMNYDDAAPSDGAPFLGTGVLTVAVDPGNGTFAWSALSSPTLDFVFPGVGPLGDDIFFDEGDIATPLANLEVILGGAGPTREFRFTGAGGGPGSGSLDLVNGAGVLLTHQPGGGSLYVLANVTNEVEYVPGGEIASPNAAIPLPAAGWLMLAGAGALAGLRRRARTRAQG